jgi:hypothetical protein
VCEKFLILCQYTSSFTPAYLHSFSYTYMHNAVHTYTYVMHILPYNKNICWLYFCTFICVLFELNFVRRGTHRAVLRLLLVECLNVHTCIFVSTLCIRLNVFSTRVCLSVYSVALHLSLLLVVAISFYPLINYCPI